MTVPVLLIEVRGEPAPQGSKSVYGGRLVESSKKVKPWRAAVVAAAAQAIAEFEWETLDGPVLLNTCFVLPRPKTVHRLWPSVRPDLDKLVRSTCDALTSAAVYADDARVVQLHASKTYATDTVPPGARITVRPCEWSY